MDRRAFLGVLAATAAVPIAAPAARAQIITAQLRGSLNAAELGLRPSATDDQSRALQTAIDQAAAADRALFLPPGTYNVSNINLTARTRIAGIAGATRIVYTGAGHLFAADGAELVHLDDLVFDGANRPLGEYVPGTVHLSAVAEIRVTGCHFIGSSGSALAVDGCGGRISGNDISGAAEAGIRAYESTVLFVTDNLVSACGNNGILIHRWSPDEDGTLVTGNRVQGIRADRGGTGPYGNGINVYQAHGVTVSQNRIADCAFTAIRANSSDNVAIIGNNCARLGEIAIFCEFAFEGAVIANNIIDSAASGISVANFNEGGRIAVVSGNVIRNLTGVGPYPPDVAAGFGIGLWIEADTSVVGNVIEGAPRAGMWIGWGPFLREVAITGNVIRDSGTGIAVSVVEGVGQAIISDNIISGADSGAITGWRWAERVTDDLAPDNAARRASLSLSNNIVVP